MLPIRIIDRQFNLINEVDEYSSLQITRSWHGIGQLELRINRYLRGASDLVRGRIIFPHNKLNKAYVIRHREIELDENGKASENWIIIALSLKSWLAQRITMPAIHTAYDSMSSNAETVMQHYVNNNVIKPTDVKRRIDGIVLAPILNRGPQISWQSRLKNLAEELTEISLLSGLGWNVRVDINSHQFASEVLEGRNLTANQTLLPPVIFSPEFNTLGRLSYSESELNYKNTAIIAGQGEGIERRIVEVGTSSGFDRYELFVDARDIAEETEDNPPIARPSQDIIKDLINRGTQKLSEHEQELYLEGQVQSQSHLVYEEHYDLGDMVTLQNREWEVTLDARITEVKEIYESRGNKLEVVFGNGRPTLLSKIKQELYGMKNEMVR